MEGYLKLWRQSLDSRVFQNEGLWKVWTWCLMKANFKKRWVSIKVGRAETEVEVLPGQFIFGRNSASKQLKMNPSTIWKRMQKLKNMQNLTIESGSKYSIISIMNWDTYQADENKSNSKGNRQVTGKEQASNTDKKDKNVKEEKKNIKKKNGFTPPNEIDVVRYFQEKGYKTSVAKKAFEFYSVADWVDSKGNKVKNWKQKMNGVWFKAENKIPIQEIHKPKTIEEREQEEKELFANR